jgi:hypothetical protein
LIQIVYSIQILLHNEVMIFGGNENSTSVNPDKFPDRQGHKFTGPVYTREGMWRRDHFRDETRPENFQWWPVLGLSSFLADPRLQVIIEQQKPWLSQDISSTQALLTQLLPHCPPAVQSEWNEYQQEVSDSQHVEQPFEFTALSLLREAPGLSHEDRTTPSFSLKQELEPLAYFPTSVPDLKDDYLPEDADPKGVLDEYHLRRLTSNLDKEVRAFAHLAESLAPIVNILRKALPILQMTDPELAQRIQQLEVPTASSTHARPEQKYLALLIRQSAVGGESLRRPVEPRTNADLEKYLEPLLKNEAVPVQVLQPLLDMLSRVSAELGEPAKVKKLTLLLNRVFFYLSFPPRMGFLKRQNPQLAAELDALLEKGGYFMSFQDGEEFDQENSIEELFKRKMELNPAILGKPFGLSRQALEGEEKIPSQIEVPSDVEELESSGAAFAPLATFLRKYRDWLMEDEQVGETKSLLEEFKDIDQQIEELKKRQDRVKAEVLSRV